MNMRLGFFILFGALIILLTICAVNGFRSHKTIGKAVGFLDVALIPPMMGNLILIGSTTVTGSLVGCYIYYIGVDLMMLALVRFTSVYCGKVENCAICRKRRVSIVLCVILGLDALQLMLNPFFGHAFALEAVTVQELPYYQVIPFFGQVFHRIVSYGVFACVILIFIMSAIKTVRIYRERYVIVLVTMIFVGVWQTFYIFSRTPVDRSMIGYGVFGILVYYFSIYYRPLRLLDRMLSNIASTLNEGLYVYDPNGNCIWANETGMKLLSLSLDDLDGVPKALRRKYGERPFTQQDWSDNYVIGSGGEAQYFHIENHFVSEDNKHLMGSYLTIRDNTEEQRRLQREIYNSTHDSLTGLYTKQYLYESIRQRLEEGVGEPYVTVFVDVKNFKIVNDVFGVAFGDGALRHISDWIRDNTNETCICGRLAGDTFGVFMPLKMFREDEVKVETALANYVVSNGGMKHRLLIHLGVYEVSEGDSDVSIMFDRAHVAISTISGNFKKHIAFYDKSLREKILWDQQITASLSEAISERQIYPYLQPITDRSGKVVGAEALARWIHPQRGFLSPVMFIPILEKNGLIVEVDRHIWRCACEILSEWKRDHSDMFISVNISPKDFYYTDVLSDILGLVREYDIEPEKLRVEITETVMMTDADEKFNIMRALREHGFIVEMDDFGSGFSSLNLLKDMPVDVLKIDMKFLSGSDNDNRSQTIIRNIIKLTEELNIVPLTEGVETVQQYSRLSDMGCKLFQGFYFAKPMPRKDFEDFAFQHKSSYR